MKHPDASLSFTIPGSLWLIPVPLIPNQPAGLPEMVQQKALSIRHYFVENIRTARRLLKHLDPAIIIDSIQFSEVNRHMPADTVLLEKWLTDGIEVGVMSEAGCPGIADPGRELVATAHRLNAKVIPLVGPNSILLALMASGLNGQGFRFVGYLPVKEPKRSKAIKSIEQLSRQTNETQIFIETPFRNNQLLNELIKNCHPDTQLCVAANLTEPQHEFVKTRTIREWQRSPVDLHKHPAVYLLMG